jgi:hypothetical protein
MSDMSLGETNKANNGTELVGGTFDENWGGNDYIFRVDGDVISPSPRWSSRDPLLWIWRCWH